MDPQRASRPVVAGVDGSEAAIRAVRWAAREADRRRVVLRLVHAHGELPTGAGTAGPGPVRGSAGSRVASRQDVLLRGMRARIAEAVAVAEEEAPGVTVEEEVLTGYPVPRLLAESGSAQLVVIGDRGLGGFTGLLVGSVAIALAAQGACPVVVVRGRAVDPWTDPVVVGVDGSPTSEAALAFAYEAAALRRVPLVAVHTWRESLADPLWAATFDEDAVEEEERAVLAERLAGWGGKYPDVEVVRVVARHGPARLLVEQSARAQLVVVGSRGRGDLAGLLLGSVSHAVLHHADCPVAVVRPVGAGSP